MISDQLKILRVILSGIKSQDKHKFSLVLRNKKNAMLYFKSAKCSLEEEILAGLAEKHVIYALAVGAFIRITDETRDPCSIIKLRENT